MSHSRSREFVALFDALPVARLSGLFTTNGIRCHQASYRKFTESIISIQNVTSCRAEFEGKRWVFGWTDIPELTSRAYMVSTRSGRGEPHCHGGGVGCRIPSAEFEHAQAMLMRGAAGCSRAREALGGGGQRRCYGAAQPLSSSRPLQQSAPLAVHSR